jgi:4'-phosphopantetheinyl transferase
VYDRPLGIDIQETKHVPERFLTRFFTPEEKEAVLESDQPDEAFTRIWCRKESFLKASGLGLSIELNSFAVLTDALVWHNTVYSFQSGQHEAFHYAFCCEGKGADPLAVHRVSLPESEG